MTSAQMDSTRSKKKLLTLAGASGIVAVVVSFALLGLAVFYSPGPFSVTQNWISDLGGMGYAYYLNVSRPIVNSYTTEILLRSGETIGGALAIIFSLGLYYDENTPSYRLGAVFAALIGVALIATAVFPEPLVLIHLFASYVLFFSSATAEVLIGSALFDTARKPLGLLAIVLGIVAFVATGFVGYERGVAELIVSLALLVFVVVFSVKMLRHASHMT